MPPPDQGLDRSEALHLQIARKIRNDIEAGVLRDGEALPSTRKLADRWDVSVFTVSEAMKVLAAEGIVVSTSRSRRVVNAPDQLLRTEIRPAKPHVVLVGGYAGSGKSELGKVLARQTGWPLIDKDTLTRPILEAALELIGLSPNDRESDTYLKLMRPREYEATMATAVENVACGNSVILAAPFLREFQDHAWLDRTQAKFADLGARMHLVWVYCDEDSMHRYIRQRGAARDNGKLADWSAYLAGIDIDFRPPVHHHVVNNCVSSAPLQSQAKDLLKDVLGEGLI